jgi:hypothetical protein
MKTLSDAGFAIEKFNYNSRRIEKVYEYLNTNYTKSGNAGRGGQNSQHARCIVQQVY